MLIGLCYHTQLSLACLIVLTIILGVMNSQVSEPLWNVCESSMTHGFETNKVSGCWFKCVLVSCCTAQAKGIRFVSQEQKVS